MLASAICGSSMEDEGSKADGATIDEHLSTLVDHSLLMVENDGDRARYRMLEVVRDHATSLTNGRTSAAVPGWPVGQAPEGAVGPPVLAG